MRRNCRYSNSISGFMDHELPESEMNEIKLHLENCPDCRVRLSRFQKATDMLLHMPEILPSIEFDTRFQEKLAHSSTSNAPGQALAERIRSWAGSGREMASMLLSSWRPYAVGAVALGILATFILKTTGGDLTPEELFLAQNLEILQEYEILSDLDLLEYWDIVENGNSES